MRHLRHLATLVMVAALLPLQVTRADIACATWNLNLFPSRLWNIRASDAVESANIKASAQFLRRTVAPLHNSDNTSLILFLQEIRDEDSCRKLLAATAIAGLKLDVISDFKDETGIAIWQQVSLASTLLLLESGSVPWRASSSVTPHRGYAYAVYDNSPHGTIACFSLHLKSNLNLSGDVREVQRNILKRELASHQILAKTKELTTKYGNELMVILGGDFNTNEDDARFVSEATLRSFYGAHFRNCFTGLAAKDRVTCPAIGRYPDATFDYILYRGFTKMTGRYIFPAAALSDHNLVAIELQQPPPTPDPPDERVR